ncbi:hypothetical protein DPMN_065963 [Dreissena polymorpha]|uniref:Uncharacterized protein n=1 Tax=Dreissena polymorpha TaxID=45954 RepID=A0A9D3YSL6_DREPO|nr:hypothetical protein DPMN_065963 [Dreissena polymorpha]
MYMYIAKVVAEVGRKLIQELTAPKRTMEVLTTSLMSLSYAVTTLVNSMLGIIRLLWQWYIVSRVAREEFPDLALPPGDMGYPVIGETIDLLKHGADFYNEKLRRYGNVYKSHLLLSPCIRVVGADNVKKILMGENTLVTATWPLSTRLLLGKGFFITGVRSRAQNTKKAHDVCVKSRDA